MAFATTKKRECKPRAIGQAGDGAGLVALKRWLSPSDGLKCGYGAQTNLTWSLAESARHLIRRPEDHWTFDLTNLPQ